MRKYGLGGVCTEEISGSFRRMTKHRLKLLYFLRRCVIVDREFSGANEHYCPSLPPVIPLLPSVVRCSRWQWAG